MSEKRFDTSNTKDRFVKRLNEKSEWKEIYSNSVVDNLLDVVAYGFDELARYMEYLYTETKWDYARSFYGLKSQGKMIGAKRSLPQVAIGSIIVSHTDVTGRDRLKNFNTLFFDLNSTSNYENGELNEKYSNADREYYSLVPWFCAETYTVQSNRQFKSSKNPSLIATSLSERTIKNATGKHLGSLTGADLQTFKDEGYWNGYKYLIVPVALGEVKHHQLGNASGKPNEAFFVPFLNVDGGLNPLTADFFTITQNLNGKITKYKYAMNLNLCDSSSECFSYEISNEEDGFYVFCGDNKNGKAFSAGATLTLDYIEANDISCKVGEIDTVTFANTDPRNGANNFLSCYNVNLINNYRPMETLDEFKTRAPASYLTEYACLNENKLIDIVKRISPTYLSDVNVEISSKKLNFYVLNKSYTQLDASEKSDLKSALTSYLSNLSYLKKEVDLGLLEIMDITAEPFKIDYILKSQYEGVDITSAAFDEVQKRILSKYHLSKKDVNEGRIETSDFGYFALSSSEISSAEPSPYLKHNPLLEPSDIVFLDKDGSKAYNKTKAAAANQNMEDCLVLVKFKPVSDDVANNYRTLTSLLNESSGFGRSSVKIDIQIENDTADASNNKTFERSILFNKKAITLFNYDQGTSGYTNVNITSDDGWDGLSAIKIGEIADTLEDDSVDQKIYDYQSFWPYATTTSLFDAIYSSPIYEYVHTVDGKIREYVTASINTEDRELYTASSTPKMSKKRDERYTPYLRAYVNEALDGYFYLLMPLNLFYGTYKQSIYGIMSSKGDGTILFNSSNNKKLKDLISSRLKVTCNIPIKRDLQSSYAGYFYTQKNLIDYRLESDNSYMVEED